ncbi:MAG: FAD:protein FMN transferase [Gammaproteobacteria bacterium WSBS_2016_MAG_OTU1]
MVNSFCFYVPIKLIDSLVFLQSVIFNHKFYKRFNLLILPSLMLFFVTGCNNTPQQQTIRSSEIFGTQITIIINGLSEDKAALAIGESFAHMENMHQQFHAWQEGELTIINRAIAADALPLTMSEPMAMMMAQSVDYARRSNGLFNPAAGKIFKAWGAHAHTPAQDLPTLALASLLPAPKMEEVKLFGILLQYAPPESKFDFGAIAKGVALDNVRDILHRHEVKDALINVGGNIMALGKNDNKAWRVRLHPVGGVVDLMDGEAIATSGDLVRSFVSGKRRYHHIIDTRTGESSVLNRATTAISGDEKHAGAISDAAATALMIADDDEAQQFLKNFGLVAALQKRTNDEIRLWGEMEERRQ